VLDAVEDVVYTVSIYGAVSDEFAYAYACGGVGESRVSGKGK